MNKRKTTIIVSTIAILGISLTAMGFLSSLKKDPPKRPPQVVKRYVKAQPATYQTIKSEVSGAGRLASQQYVDVIAEVQGKILRGNVPLKKGQAFKAGDLLVKLFDKEARLALLAKKSRFLNAVASLLPDFKVDFPESYKRWQDFFAAIDIEKDLPKLPVNGSGKEKIFLAGRNILSDYYAIKSDEIRLKKYNIHAPFTGTYTDVMLEVGSIANPGTKLAKIIRTDIMELEIPVEVNQAGWIEIGDATTVTTEDGSRSWTGKVVRKSQFVDPDTQSIEVFVQLKSTRDKPLYNGLYLKALFPGANLDNVMEIPRGAVFNQNEVFVVKEGKLAKQEIDIHKINRDSIIFSGVPAGLNVVVEPLINASENTPVEIISPNNQ
jgi:multidrug efflux pump subunit AcrA (membrane-fusion protein)